MSESDEEWEEVVMPVNPIGGALNDQTPRSITLPNGAVITRCIPME